MTSPAHPDVTTKARLEARVVRLAIIAPAYWLRATDVADCLLAVVPEFPVYVVLRTQNAVVRGVL